MINEVVLIGRMVKDPDLRYTSDGTPVASFRLAVNRSFKNHEGVIEADFVSCTAWRNLAKTTADYCRKGALVAVTGRIQTSRYEGKDGTAVFVTDIVVDNVRFLEKKREDKQAVAANAKTTVLANPPPPAPDNQQSTGTEQGQKDSRNWEWTRVPQENREDTQSTPNQEGSQNQQFQKGSHESSHTQKVPDFLSKQKEPENVEV
ncbi:single-stranded DNA-binding protein [Bacillus sp. LL01]|uniref:single-stranded DNA-binding protein n=1 Tax=Bacillus sp. LL01 TaxID=1665556 RepID=UPI0009E3B489|nr:single-stranded DNA-binding protein [Bacillus sp. LL01]